MNRTLQIAIACFIGAGLGTLVALELIPALAWIGGVVGFFAGYLSYESKKVVLAIPCAFKAAFSWRFDKKRFRDAVWESLGFVSVISTLIVLLGLTFITISFALSFFIVSFSLAFAFLFCFLVSYNVKFIIGNRQQEAKKAIVYANVFTVCFYWLPQFVWFIAKNACLGFYFGTRAVIRGAPGFVRGVGRFFKYLFKLIHSEIRLLCATDSFIGACIGYFAGSVLVGALSGAIIGVLNYEFVSKRLLKLVPVPARSH